MAEGGRSAEPALAGGISRLQYLTLGFGTIIGSAWVVLLGGWLAEAGPGGAMLGFVAGGLTMMLIGRCYSELIGRIPEAGGEFVYAYRLFGPTCGFLVGWFLLLYLIGVIVYEALALARVIELLAPRVEGPALYSAFGDVLTLDAVLIGGIMLGAIVFANLLGVRVAVRFHGVMTFGFVATALLVIVWLCASGSAANARPLFHATTGRPWWQGTAALFAFSAYGYYGFQAIPQTIEERSSAVPLRTVAAIVGVSIGMAMIFYCAIILAVSVAAPWQSSIRSPLAPVAVALLAATAMSLLKAWNGVFMMAVRLAIAMARTGLLPAAILRRDPRTGAARHAVGLVAALNLAGLFLGRGAIGPITDMCAMVLTVTYILCVAAVSRLRRRGGARGGILVWLALAGAVVMAAAALVTPFLRDRAGFPLEWRLLTVWGGLGAALWIVLLRPRRMHDVAVLELT